MSQEVRTLLRRPILTEKTTHGIEALNAYVFEIAPGANKLQVRKAVEEIFDVKVVKVNIRRRRGKLKRIGRSYGYGKDKKEAIVTLRTGDKIDVY
jgi:large subunit ribosomal protein L23